MCAPCEEYLDSLIKQITIVRLVQHYDVSVIFPGHLGPAWLQWLRSVVHTNDCFPSVPKGVNGMGVWQRRFDCSFKHVSPEADGAKSTTVSTDQTVSQRNCPERHHRDEHALGLS